MSKAHFMKFKYKLPQELFIKCLSIVSAAWFSFIMWNIIIKQHQRTHTPIVRSSSSYCHVYKNTSRGLIFSNAHTCFNTTNIELLPSFWICLQKYAYTKPTQSLDITNELVDILSLHPNLGLINIGLHDSILSIAAALRGHPVLVVEHQQFHIVNLQLSMEKNLLTFDQIKLIDNILIQTSNLPRIVEIELKDGERMETNLIQTTKQRRSNGIYVDDLLEVTSFNHSILTITNSNLDLFDQHMENLIDHLIVYAILIEWGDMKYILTGKTATKLERVIKFLKSRHYTPWTINKNDRYILDIDDWIVWPKYILWILT